MVKNNETHKNIMLSPKNDIVFQVLFGEEGSEEITKSFLETILMKKVTDVDLSKNPILRRTKMLDKLGILDVIVEIDNKEYCDIEIQVAKQEYILERLLYYWAKTFAKTIHKGKDYSNLKKTISILITDFEADSLKELNCFTKWKIIEEENRQKILTEYLEIYIIILPKMNEKSLKNNKLLEWLKFLENPESEEVKNITKENVAIKKAHDKLEEISHDEAMEHLIDMEESYRYLLNTERSIGENKKAKEIAKKMKDKGMNINSISEITGLSEDEINKL